MNIPRLFQAASLEVGVPYSLDEPGYHHLIHVRRHGLEEPVILFNGQGGEYHGKLVTISRREAIIHLEKFVDIERESSLDLHLMQAMPGREKMDFILQKATELGVTQITPLATAKQAYSLSEEQCLRRQYHWQRVIISACEQCGRNRLPTLNPIRTIAHTLQEEIAPTQYIFHPRAEGTLTLPKSSSIAIAIGPEAGFSDEEITYAQQAGWQPIQLGPRILRTETSSLAIISSLQCLKGDFGGNA